MGPRHPTFQRTKPFPESPPKVDPFLDPTALGKDLQRFVYSQPVIGPGASLFGQADSGHAASAACEFLQGRPGSASLPAALAAGSDPQGTVLTRPVYGPCADIIGPAGSGHVASAACGFLQGRPGSASLPAVIAAGSDPQGTVLKRPVYGPCADFPGQAGSGHAALAACESLRELSRFAARPAAPAACRAGQGMVSEHPVISPGASLALSEQPASGLAAFASSLLLARQTNSTTLPVASAASTSMVKTSSSMDQSQAVRYDPLSPLRRDRQVQGPRDLQISYMSPNKAERTAVSSEASKPGVARALPFGAVGCATQEPSAAIVLPEASFRKRKRSTVSADGFGAAAGKSQESLVTRDRDRLRAAEAEGTHLRTVQFRVEALYEACNQLIQVLPQDWLVAMMDEARVSFDELDPADVLTWFKNHAVGSFWSPTDLRRVKATLAWLIGELEARDLLPESGDLGEVPTWRIETILHEFRDRKQAELRAKKPATTQPSYQDRLVGATNQTAAPAAKGWTGATIGQYYLRGLKFAQKHLKSTINAQGIVLKTGWDGGQRENPAPAPSTTIFIVVALEEFLARSNNVVQQHVAAAYLFLCYACMRCAQAQDCWVTGTIGDEFIEGYVSQEKNPNRQKKFPRPFWAPLYGITGSRRWFDILMSTLHDVSGDNYIFRAFDSGSIFKAERLVNRPLRCGHEIQTAMSEILQLACGFTIPESMLYTQHSPRHFLNETARARGEAPSCRHEIGRWSLSVAQFDFMRPFANCVRRHMLSCMVMPDIYSAAAAKLRPMAIIRRQMNALRQLVQRHGESAGAISAAFPRFGGWELLDPFIRTGAEHEE